MFISLTDTPQDPIIILLYGFQILNYPNPDVSWKAALSKMKASTTSSDTAFLLPLKSHHSSGVQLFCWALHLSLTPSDIPINFQACCWKSLVYASLMN